MVIRLCEFTSSAPDVGLRTGVPEGKDLFIRDCLRIFDSVQFLPRVGEGNELEDIRISSEIRNLNW